jgi:type III pantothenate kinase
MPTIAAVSLGNSTVAAGLWRGSRFVFRNRLPTADLGRKALFAGARRRDLAGVAVAAVAAVVPARERALERAIRRELGAACPVRWLGRDLDPGLKLRVKCPAAVGADRLASALATWRRFGAAVVVDFGTAVTVNAVSATGEFLGGAILPGAELSARALASGTARKVGAESAAALRRPARLPGRSTTEAVSAGVAYGLAGAVDRLVAETAAALGGRPALVATGGGAKRIVPLCRTKFRVLPDLVLEGLARAASEST